MKADNSPVHHPSVIYIAKYCIGQLDVAPEPGAVTSILHILTLLKDVLHQFPKSHVKVLARNMLV